LSSSLRKFWKFIKRNETARGLLLVGIVILGALGVWGGIRLALNTEYPVLVVSSGSMCPANYCTLPIGALILIRGQDPSSITAGPDCGTPAVGPSATSGPLGSIIVFRPYLDSPDYLVVHRVRQIVTLPGNVLGFRTEGDNFYTNPSCDGWTIPSSQIVGVYQTTIPIPYLGSAILGIRNFMYDDTTGQPRPEGILVIVILIIALFAFEVIEPSKKAKPEVAKADPSPAPAPTPAPAVSDSPNKDV
jgi:hypothetical protein